MQDIDIQFEDAVKLASQLPQKPSNQDLLKIYGLFKQATEGDNDGERPGGFDFKAIAKFDAWKELSGKTTEEAKQEYIQLIERLNSN